MLSVLAVVPVVSVAVSGDVNSSAFVAPDLLRREAQDRERREGKFGEKLEEKLEKERQIVREISTFTVCKRERGFIFILKR